MNSASKFFGFILVPIFAFILGFHVASRDIFPDKELDPSTLDPEKSSKAMSLFRNLLEKEIDLQLIEEMLAIIDDKYVDPEKIDSQKITYGLAKGLIYSLEDPFSGYMTPDESSDFQEGLDGSLEGIGAELTMKNGNVVVVSPLKNSPAISSGLLPQDIIVKVDDEDINELSLEKVVQKIRGLPNTKVKITVARRNTDELIDIEIIRQKIIVESVTMKMIDDIAILEVSQFGTNTKEEFKKYLSDAIVNNPAGIVLDLRFNSGGFLEKARDLVSFFVDDGKVVVIKSRPPNIENIFVNGEKITDLPLVVLQNKGSASASEIVSGALKDFGRATIIGTTSFGKGTVQEVVPLKHGGNLRITIAKWLTPNGVNINEKGIEPDYYVENTLEDYKNERDPQMDAAIKFLHHEDISDLVTEKEE